MFKDNVKCCNCWFNGLVDFGEDECPECGVLGTLSWKDDEHQEVEVN
jgi:hypothetical protein